jgi:hypothetical protein
MYSQYVLVVYSRRQVCSIYAHVVDTKATERAVVPRIDRLL